MYKRIKMETLLAIGTFTMGTIVQAAPLVTSAHTKNGVDTVNVQEWKKKPKQPKPPHKLTSEENISYEVRKKNPKPPHKLISESNISYEDGKNGPKHPPKLLDNS